MVVSAPHFSPIGFSFAEPCWGAVWRRPHVLTLHREPLSILFRRRFVEAEPVWMGPDLGASLEGVVNGVFSKVARGFTAVTVLVSLAGCIKQNEQTLRQQLSGWLKLGDTQYFYATSRCSAAVFALKSLRVNSLVKRARSMPSGMKLIARGEPVVFAIEGQSPTDVTQQIMSYDLHSGLGVVSSGLSGKNCMTDPLRSAYFDALINPDADLIYNPEDHAILVVDPDNKRLFYVWGKV